MPLQFTIIICHYYLPQLFVTIIANIMCYNYLPFLFTIITYHYYTSLLFAIIIYQLFAIMIYHN